MLQTEPTESSLGHQPQDAPPPESYRDEYHLPYGGEAEGGDNPDNGEDGDAFEPQSPLDDGSDCRRWYHWGQAYLTYAEFRNTPMGQDILQSYADLPEAEEHMEEVFMRFPTERQHRSVGGMWDLQPLVWRGKPWRLLCAQERAERIVSRVSQAVGLVGLSYLFLVCLGVLGDAFTILTGRFAGRSLRDYDLLTNPVSGAALGLFSTVLVQSSDTTTTVAISLAAAGTVTVQQAAYLVIGANIGTAITSALVSLAHLGSTSEHRRAFTAAAYHAHFNWCTAVIFLPLEASSACLSRLAKEAADSLGFSSSSEPRDTVAYAKGLSTAARGRVVEVDTGLIERIAAAESSAAAHALERESIITETSAHLFRDRRISDTEVGVLLMFVSIAMLVTLVLVLIALLRTSMRGGPGKVVRVVLNLHFRHPVLRACGGLDSYLLLVVGGVLTVLLHSSSMFTSLVAVLTALGAVHIEKAAPLIVGANLGATISGLLAALSGDNVYVGLQVALVNVFFNCAGGVLWFVVWPLRQVPLSMAQFLGDTGANLRWFTLMHTVAMFVGIPWLVILVSYPGWGYLVLTCLPLIVVLGLLLAFVHVRRNHADIIPRGSAFAFLRSDHFPCGCMYPNFMQLWGGDVEFDRIDLSVIRQKAWQRKVDDHSARIWPYSTAAWGLACIAFLGAVLCLPTTQWRRVRYADEPRGRPEFGIGLWHACSASYEQDHRLMHRPPRECTYTDLLYECAEGLERSCQADPLFATNQTTPFEDEAYAAAFQQCSKLGCRAHAWVQACRDIPACHARPRHAEQCAAVVETYAFYRSVNPDSHGVQLLWADPRGDVLPETAGFHSGAFAIPAEEEEGEVQVRTFDLPELLNEGTGVSMQPSLAGLSHDPCTGVLHAATVRGCNTDSNFTGALVRVGLITTHTRMSISHTSSILQHTTLQHSPPHSTPEALAVGDTCAAAPYTAADGPAVGDIAILDTDTGMHIGCELYDPHVLVWNSTGHVVARYAAQGSGTQQGTVYVLPRVFAARAALRGFKSLAVSPSRKRAVVCLASALTGESAALAYSRVVRCAVLDITNYRTPRLLAEKLVVLRDAGELQPHVQLVGASWLKDDTVLLLERSGSGPDASARLLRADFASGTDIQGAYDSTNINSETGLPHGLDLELLSVNATDNLPLIHTTASLIRAGAEPVSVRHVLDLPATLPLQHLSGVAALNSHSFAVSEQGRDNTSIHVVQSTRGTGAALPDMCPHTRNFMWRGGSRCRSLQDVCPVGGLADHMEVVSGLAIAGVTTLGLGAAMIATYVLQPRYGVVSVMHFAAAAFLTFASILLLAAWTEVAAMTNKTYGCYFEDESLRGGLVLHLGKLRYLTQQSYSWAFCIYGWGVVTLACVVLWHRVFTENHVRSLLLLKPEELLNGPGKGNAVRLFIREEHIFSPPPVE